MQFSNSKADTVSLSPGFMNVWEECHFMFSDAFQECFDSRLEQKTSPPPTAMSWAVPEEKSETQSSQDGCSSGEPSK